MQCSNVGAEVWLFWALTTAAVAAFVLRARDTQRWLRDHPRLARNALFLYFGRERLLDERHLWFFRFAYGTIPLLMWVVSWMGVYCYFHGPDVPPPGR